MLIIYYILIIPVNADDNAPSAAITINPIGVIANQPHKKPIEIDTPSAKIISPNKERVPTDVRKS